MPRKQEEFWEGVVGEAVEVPERRDFHIGQCYEDDAVTTLVCSKCGGDKFLVGNGSWFTAIKCPVCLWEQCVADG